MKIMKQVITCCISIYAFNSRFEIRICLTERLRRRRLKTSSVFISCANFCSVRVLSTMSTSFSHPLIGAIDQGTSSTRFFVFSSKTAERVADHQIEVKQIFPQEGWVEEDPMEILDTVLKCIESTVEQLRRRKINLTSLKAIGISNQRETTILWDKYTGKPLHNAIVWLDTRTHETVEEFIEKAPGSKKDGLQSKCGLPLSTYFSAVKIAWLIKNVPEISRAIADNRCLFGTVDSWLLWNLTGGPKGGVHCTDVSNASRTMLMNIKTLQWDNDLCNFFGVPAKILPEIRSCSEIYGSIAVGSLTNVPISGCLGDQSAALVGQMCFNAGMAKNTYGTGCFLLYNTGSKPIFSSHGLLTTVGYKLGKDKPVTYALEGSVAIAGASIRWLRDNLNLIETEKQVETIASSVTGSHGVYFVPAFSGLFAPHWESEAKGMIVGLTQFATKAHILRAALDAVCFQTREILEAMNMDSGIALQSLRVDGGMCKNDLLMQLQADIVNIPVVRPAMLETTALGAAMAAGAAEGVNVWSLDPRDMIQVATDIKTPSITVKESNLMFMHWKRAVDCCIYWAKLHLESGQDEGFKIEGECITVDGKCNNDVGNGTAEYIN